MVIYINLGININNKRVLHNFHNNSIEMPVGGFECSLCTSNPLSEFL